MGYAIAVLALFIAGLVVCAVEDHLDEVSHDERTESFADALAAEAPDAERILPLIRARAELVV